MHRREFLKGGLLTTAGLLAEHFLPQVLKAATDFRNLKITAVDVFPLKTGSIFVLVRTNEGITGLGECSPMNARVIVSMLRDALIHYEEPIAQHDYAGYAEVCAALDMAVAAGEHEYTRWQFRDLIEKAKVDILQPDLVKCAGLSEGIRIAHLAHTHGKFLVPHQTQPTIGGAANLHFLACFDNSSRAQEYNHSPQNSELLWGLFKTNLAPKNGYCTVPDGPGLGLELDEKAMKTVSL